MSLNNTSQYINNLYDYRPAYKNLYKIEILGDINMCNYCLLHATQVSFNGESLTLQRHPVTKQFTLPGKSEAYKLADDLKITWREDDLWTVKRFHEEWLACFYNKTKDQYVHGRTGKFKDFLITLPGGQRILFKDVLPKNVVGLDLQWSPQGNIIAHNLDYYVTSWKWYPNESLDKGIVVK